MSLKTSLLLTFIALSVLACDKKRIFEQYHTVGPEWHKDTIVSYELPETDTTKLYNAFVNVRSNDQYQFNNLYLIVSLDQPGGITKVDTLEYQMADAEGNLLGNGFSDIKESKLFYKERMKFKKGAYKVHIRQAVRERGKVTGVETLKGITDVGFSIESLQ